ncbi:MAG: DUF167 domain-containing protein [Sphingomonas adhaesiva]|uniref:DUF167 domain-containing protein n=1 Tax=Sphingomonas adhaesiva TaxID=28212 RepID=UPI002FF914F9
MSAWAATARGLTIAVRATPRGGRDALLAGTGEHFLARLAAAPVDGAANDALVALVAHHFGVPRRDVTLVAGHRARIKRVTVAGDAAALAEIAAALYAAAP